MVLRELGFSHLASKAALTLKGFRIRSLQPSNKLVKAEWNRSRNVQFLTVRTYSCRFLQPTDYVWGRWEVLFWSTLLLVRVCKQMKPACPPALTRPSYTASTAQRLADSVLLSHIHYVCTNVKMFLIQKWKRIHSSSQEAVGKSIESEITVFLLAALLLEMLTDE